MNTYATDPRLAEKVLVCAAFFFGAGAVITLFRLPDPSGDPWAGPAEDAVSRTLWLFFYAVMLYLVVPHRRELLRLIRANIWIPCLMALVVLSALWSPDPALTLRRAIAIDLGAIYGFYLALRFTTKQVVQLLVVALGAALLVSAAVIALFPTYGVYEDAIRGETWRGVFLHKNPLGRAAALALVACVVVVRYPGRRWIAGGVSVLAILCLIGSASATAFIAAGVPALILLALVGARRLGGLGTVGIVLVVSSVVIGTVAVSPDVSTAGARDSALAGLGKERTLTDRTRVWEEASSAIERKPVLGYGVSGFWRGWEGAGSAAVWERVRWHPTHAHSGYLDVTLELGLVGLLALLLSLLTALRQLVETAHRGLPIERLWPMLFVPFLLLESVTESVLMRSNSLYWILFVFTLAAIAKGAHARQVAFPSGSVRSSGVVAG